MLLKTGKTIESDDLGLVPVHVAPQPTSTKVGDGLLTNDLSKGLVLEELEPSISERVLLQTRWNRTKVAQLVGLSRETLHYRIEKHNRKAPYSAGDP